MSDIARIEVRVALAHQRPDFHGHGGQAAHGFLLEVCRGYDPALARRIHEGEGLKPLSVSPVTIDGAEARLSCATLDAGSSRGILAALQDAVENQRALGLAGAEVRVAEINTLTSSHDTLLRRASKSRRIELAFLSPTLFRRSGESLVLPQPELAFGSLLRAWNAFSPLQFPPYGAEDLGAPMICHHNIHTEMVQFGSYKLLGFVGRVGYLIPAEAPELLCRTLNCLADYAFFAGVGYRTTMGMGQCRRA